MIYTDTLFVFAFLPVVTALICILREPWEKNLLSVVASLVFIAFARPLYYLLIIVPVAVTYIFGRLIEKKGYNWAGIVGTLTSGAFSLWAILSLEDLNSFSSKVASLGFFLFTARTLVYLSEVTSTKKSEKDFLSLAVYLMSYEFMLVSPLCKYSRIENTIKSRSVSLAKMSLGVERFVFGLARVSLFGFAFEKVIISALYSDATPWMNVIIGSVATIIEFYIIVIGFCEMSQGLTLIGGMVVENGVAGIRLRPSVFLHVKDFYESGAMLIKESVLKKSAAWQLVAASVAVGLCFGLGLGGCAFAAILLLVIMIESLSSEKTLADRLIAFLALVIGWLVLVCGSPSGVLGFFSSLDRSLYDFDISYSLYTELERSAVWLLLGALSLTPIYKVAYAKIREKSASSDRAYSLVRTSSAVVSLVLAVLCVISIVSSLGTIY